MNGITKKVGPLEISAIEDSSSGVRVSVMLCYNGTIFFDDHMDTLNNEKRFSTESNNMKIMGRFTVEDDNGVLYVRTSVTWTGKEPGHFDGRLLRLEDDNVPL